MIFVWLNLFKWYLNFEKVLLNSDVTNSKNTTFASNQQDKNLLCVKNCSVLKSKLVLMILKAEIYHNGHFTIYSDGENSKNLSL